eukprot:jgi/Botrbrau1/19059/Bobra.0100s0083.1
MSRMLNFLDNDTIATKFQQFFAPIGGDVWVNNKSYAIRLHLPNPITLEGRYSGPWLTQEARPAHGEGSFETPTLKYHGKWQNAMMHGQGTMTWLDGRSYTGKWAHNRMHGFGEFKWVDIHETEYNYKGEYWHVPKGHHETHGNGEFTWGPGNWLKGYGLTVTFMVWDVSLLTTQPPVMMFT